MSKPKAKPTFPYESLSDCDRPACDDIVSMFQEASRAAGAESARSASEASHNIANSKTAAAMPESSTPHTPTKPVTKATHSLDEACPPSSAKLGQSTWTLLHTMAAWYPDEPTTTEQTSMKRFFSALGRFYPCPWCATDFRVNLEERPPQ
jgi:FAD-linked sulfhydryl oxidase